MQTMRYTAQDTRSRKSSSLFFSLLLSPVSFSLFLCFAFFGVLFAKCPQRHACNLPRTAKLQRKFNSIYFQLAAIFGSPPFLSPSFSPSLFRVCGRQIRSSKLLRRDTRNRHSVEIFKACNLTKHRNLMPEPH